MKKNRLAAVLSAMAVCSLIHVNAAYANKFEGSVSWTYGDVSGYVTKTTSTSTRAAVNWYYTDEQDHKQWFRIVNSNGAKRGEVLVSSCDGMNHLFTNSNTTQNYIYKLQSKREHIINPTTHIKGTWRP